MRISNDPVSELYHSSVFLETVSPSTRSLSPITFFGPEDRWRINKDGKRTLGNSESLEIVDDDDDEWLKRVLVGVVLPNFAG